MKKKFLFIIAFIEGFILMAYEILSVKIVAPFFGNSIDVWASMFFCTLFFLALGYFFSRFFISKKQL
jgi:hypothetical protein